MNVYAYFSSIDNAAFSFTQSLQSQQLTAVMVPLAESFLVVLPLILIYMALRKDRNVYAMFTYLVVAYIVSEVLKYLFMEPRPCSLADYSSFVPPSVSCESGYAFPSSHATVLTGGFILLGKYRVLQILYVVWMLLVLFGRVYLVAHFFSDIVAGAALSLIIVYGAYRFRMNIYDIARKVGLSFITG